MTAKPEVVNHFLATYAPPVLDPFAGGGSIPLEAQRLGLKAYASDLNPVPVLINKALIEIPPKFANLPPVNPDYQSKSKAEKTITQWHGAQGLAEDVRYYGQWMRDQAEKRIGHLYPKVKITQEMAKGRPDLKPYIGQELTVIAWLWARTVRCPNPICSKPMPMVRNFMLSTKKGKEVYLHPIINESNSCINFEIRTGNQNVTKHTTDRTGNSCIFCGRFIKKPELRNLACQHGIGEIPLAIVAEGKNGRLYLPFINEHVPTISKPDAPELRQLITNDKRWFSPPLYGLPEFRDLFTPRQLTALTTFSDLVMEAREKILSDARTINHLPQDNQPLAEGGSGSTAYADAIATYLAFGVDKAADYWSNLCSWHSSKELIRNTFGRQALPMVWDFAEPNPFQQGTGGFGTEWGEKTLKHLFNGLYGSARQLDATAAINGVSGPVISTDPPYYDNIGYADLSDFFYIWLRRSLGRVFPQLFATLLTPKAQELIASPYRHDGSKEKAQTFFEEGLGKAFARMREVHQPDIPLTVYYAFKQAEEDGDEEDTTHAIASTGWETMLSGLIQSGFSIHGTWPMRTELGNRMVGKDTNALASSIVLVCRPRPADAPLATRREFMAALKHELPLALRDLQRGSVAPVDLAQASIGPGMAVFTRYAKVMESDGSAMTVRTALSLINQILDETLAAQEGEFDADTRWAISWFEQFGMEEGPYGVAETLSKAKNTAVNGLVEAGILAARGGKVRLLKREELAADWDPTTDQRLAVWEAVQYLIRTLEQQGEQAAAQLLRKLGGLGETIRDLAYRLYSLCERKKWAQEALAYNSLVVAWPEIAKLAQSATAETISKKPKDKQLFE